MTDDGAELFPRKSFMKIAYIPSTDNVTANRLSLKLDFIDKKMFHLYAGNTNVNIFRATDILFV